MADVASTASVVNVSESFQNNASKALTLLIDKVSSGLDAATSFLAQQIPDVIHQILVYNFITSLGRCILFFVMIFAWPCLMRWSYKHWIPRLQVRANYSFDQKDCGTLLTLFSIIGMIIFILCFFGNFSWLKIWFAPKIYLIEYATDLVKSLSGSGS